MASINSSYMGFSNPPSPRLYQLFSASSDSSASRSSSIRSSGSDQADLLKPDKPTKNEEEEEQVVYLAMGDKVKTWTANLSWVLKSMPKTKKIAVLHVHQPSKTFNMMGAMVAAENLSDSALAAYQQMEAEKLNKTKKSLLNLFARLKMKPQILIYEGDDIAKGLVFLISQHGVTELVMGAVADKYYSKKMNAPTSKKALAVNELANPQCKIWFVCSGNLICIREPRQITSMESMATERMAPTPDRMTPTSHSSAVEVTLTPSARSLYNEDKDDDDVPYPKGRWAQDEYELDEMKRQRDDLLQDLSRSDKHRETLEVEVVKMKRMLEELKAKLAEAHNLILHLEKDNEKLQLERVCVVKEANLLRKRVQELEKAVHKKMFCEFKYEELKEATKGFDDSLKIGEGGYGSVYKGLLRGSSVAIKILNPCGMQGKDEFFQEMSALSKVRHPNLVSLIGACPETWALVYEFLPNGSLEDRLSCKGGTSPLTWQARTRIAAEVCSALVFLHSTEEPVSLIHGDLKPSNILLDSNFVSQLSDFGLCRLLELDDSAILNRHSGDMGSFVYMDPEFLASGELRPCSDVYSFGIVLLRLLTARPTFGIINEAQKAVRQGKLERILDKSAGEWPLEVATSIATLALRCCEIKRDGRPDLATEAWKVLEPMMNHP